MDKMREEFELAVVNGVVLDGIFGHEFSKSIRKIQVSDCFTCGKYQNDLLQASWEAWQASRAALCVKLPSDMNGEYYADGWNACLMRVEESLDDVGVRYE